MSHTTPPSLTAAGACCCLLQVGFVASFASKLADTSSSEIGKAYGQTTYLITTLQRVPRGTEGAVSLEGTAAGMVAAAGVAGMALALGQVRPGNRLAPARGMLASWAVGQALPRLKRCPLVSLCPRRWPATFAG
jgi:uncharacterized protein (TIGR00297 family)